MPYVLELSCADDQHDVNRSLRLSRTVRLMGLQAAPIVVNASCGRLHCADAAKGVRKRCL